MQIVFAADHAGYEMKNTLLAYVRDELDYAVLDCGADSHDPDDDYPVYVHKAAERVAHDPEGVRGIILGASGQGEAMVANRHHGVRAAVYYGEPGAHQVDAHGEHLDLITSTRKHNNANMLSLGARFIDESEARSVVKRWLETAFSGQRRHIRRIGLF